MAASALETDRLCKSFGALTVADSISFRLEPGARHALIGPNGAGKTTFVNMLSGRIPPSSGKILLGGRSEEHTSELQSRFDLVCRLLLEKKNIHHRPCEDDAAEPSHRHC